MLCRIEGGPVRQVRAEELQTVIEEHQQHRESSYLVDLEEVSPIDARCHVPFVLIFREYHATVEMLGVKNTHGAGRRDIQNGKEASIMAAIPLWQRFKPAGEWPVAYDMMPERVRF